MKIRRKSDGLIKNVPDERSKKYLSDPDFEQIQDTSAPSADSVQDPVEDNSLLASAGDTARGVVQGGTLGFSDEAYGAIGATGDKLAGLVSGEQQPDWTELYRQYQQAEQGRNKLSQERSPWLYGGGELAGAVGAGLLTAGAGTVAPAVTGAAGEVYTGLRAANLIGGAGAVAKSLGTTALKGAVAGGVQAAGTSEGNLDNIESRAKLTDNINKGTAFGGAFGAAIPIAGAAASKVGDSLKNSSFWRGIGQGFDRGRNSASIGKTESGVERATLEKATLRDTLADKLVGADDQIGAIYGQVLDAATEQGVQIPLTSASIKGLSAVNQLAAGNQVIASTPSFAKLQALVNKVSNLGTLSPREAVDLKDLVREVSESLDSPATQKYANALLADIKEALNQNVSGFKEVNGLMANYRGGVLDKITDRPYNSIAAGKEQKVVGGKLQEVLGKYNTADDYSTAAREKVNAVEGGINALEKQSPGIAEELGLGSGQAIKDDVATGSDMYDFIHKMLGNYGHTGGKSAVGANILSQGASYGVGKLYGTAQLAGGVAKKVGHMFNLPVEQVNNYATKLSQSQNPMAQGVGKYLSDAIANKDDFKKNSALFIINQNPALKELLGFGEEEQP